MSDLPALVLLAMVTIRGDTAAAVGGSGEFRTSR